MGLHSISIPRLTCLLLYVWRLSYFATSLQCWVPSKALHNQNLEQGVLSGDFPFFEYLKRCALSGAIPVPVISERVDPTSCLSETLGRVRCFPRDLKRWVPSCSSPQDLERWVPSGALPISRTVGPVGCIPVFPNIYNDGTWQVPSPKDLKLKVPPSLGVIRNGRSRLGLLSCPKI